MRGGEEGVAGGEVWLRGWVGGRVEPERCTVERWQGPGTGSSTSVPRRAVWWLVQSKRAEGQAARSTRQRHACVTAGD